MGLSLSDKCKLLPPSGGGGCHPALLGAANTGVRQGYSDQDILSTIRQHLDDSARPISDKEILDTIRTARATDGKAPNSSRSWALPPMVSGTMFRQLLIDASPDPSPNQLIASSPTPLPANPRAQTELFLNRSYGPSELVFIGPAFSADKMYIQTPSQHLATRTESLSGAFIPNPLTGLPSKTADGLKMSFRADASIASHRYFLWEMDSVSIADQIRMWTTITRDHLLPVHSITMSGGKSLHALIRVDCNTREQWDILVRGQILRAVAEPMGADGACGNPGRLSRLPGCQEEGRDVQWLLWLA